MVQALFDFGRLNKRNRVMAWVTVEKSGLKCHPWCWCDLDVVADPHAQHIPIKVNALLSVIDQDHKMAESQVTSVKPRNRSG